MPPYCGVEWIIIKSEIIKYGFYIKLKSTGLTLIIINKKKSAVFKHHIPFYILTELPK